MACELRPAAPIHELPSPFTITPPAVPPFSGNLNLCCKIVGFSTPPIPFPLPPGVSRVMGTIINTMMSAIQPYFDALPLPCPKE